MVVMLEGDAPIHKQFEFLDRGDRWAARFKGLALTAYGNTKVDAKMRLMEMIIAWAQAHRNAIVQHEVVSVD